MNCDICELEEVTFIVGNAQTGDQQMLGPACFSRMALEIAKAVLPAEEIASTLGPMFVTPGKPAGKIAPVNDAEGVTTASRTAETASPEGSGAPRSRKSKGATKEPRQAPRPSQGPAEAHAAGEDG